MNDLEKQEKLYDLLSEQAVFGLREEDTKELEDLLNIFPEWQNDETFALTATAISLSAIPADEKMPAHLKSRILADSEKFFVAEKTEEYAPRETKIAENVTAGGFFERLLNINWLGWAVAGAACVALGFNLWLTRSQPNDIVRVQPTPTPTVVASPSLAQQREQLVSSAGDVITSNWTDFDPKTPRGVQGDVVWSNSQQKGFVRFRGLPVNDKTAETYQIWIFDKAQKNPVSGGVFDANEAGEIVIPIDSAIKVQTPTMFGITAEKPGGVMVSDLKKVMAVAKLKLK